ncbi:ATP-binding protein, partial [Streptomyces spiralis]
AEAAKAAAEDDSVLFVDSFERCQGLEGWLREHFLPSLSAHTVTVVAGRFAPATEWRYDLVWSEALQVLELGPLESPAATALLEGRGVPPSLREPVLAFAGGHPLALALAASVAVRDDGPDREAGTLGDDKADWSPTPDVITTLLYSLVGELPSQQHRMALEVAAHTLVTTEDLLGAVVGVEHAGAMFAWLRTLPFSDHGRQGLFLHDLVADCLDRDLRWRDPHGYEEMHRRAGHHLLQRVRTAAEPQAMTAVRALTHLKRYGPMAPYFQQIEREGDVREDQLRPGDADAIIRMTEQTEGERSARIVRHWLRRQPQAFHTYRDTHSGDLVAFMTWLSLTEPAPEDHIDPVVTAAWAHVTRTAPLRPGQHLLMSRFMVHPAAYGQVSTVGHLMQLRICLDWIRGNGLAWSFIVSPDAALWEGLMHHLGHRQVWHTPWEHGRTFTAFACDWRTTPLEIWFDRTQPGALHEAAPAAGRRAGTASLTHDEFRSAVRGALKALHDTELLANSPLLTSQAVTTRADHTGDEPVTVLRQLLSAAVDTLQGSRSLKAHRAVTVTYLQRPRTQEAAAERLGLPFSTYRRHLAHGVNRVCELMWEQATSATATPPHGH